VKDKALRRKLIPNYRIGCKRILNSSTYYRAVADPKTELITEGISRITRDGIVTVDGKERPVDVIVYGTGFHVTDSYTYVQIKGRDGEDLVDRWNREGIGAHRGVTVANMPNLFFLLGPNTGLGHNSVVFMIESQIRYVADAIKQCDKLNAQALAPRRAAQDKFNDDLQRRLGPSVWNSGGCSSWYLDEHGKNTVLWGGYTWEYWRDTRAIRYPEYEFFGVGA
jgi:cation diffusion facilitator CzcD-associated flavoprotein CzcO